MRLFSKAVIAAAVLAVYGTAIADRGGNSGSNSGQGNLANLHNLNTLVAPAVLNNPAAANIVRVNSGPVGRNVVGSVGPVVEPVRFIGTQDGPGSRHQPRGKMDVVDKLDDAKVGKTVAASDKSDAKKSEAAGKIAANTTDDAAPSQQAAARPNVPPPACQ